MRPTRPRHFYLALAFVAAIALGPSAAWAQCTAQDRALPKDTPWRPEQPFVVLALLDANDCLGGPGDQAPIAASVRKALEVPPDDTTLFRPAADAALGLIGVHLQKTVTPASPEVVRDLRRQVDSVRTTLGSGLSPALPTAWELDDGRIFAISQPIKGYVDGACVKPGAECTTAFDAATEVLRIARLTRRALLTSETPFVRALLAENLKREKSWNDYFDRARSQYIWELALNGSLMEDTRQEVVPAVKGGAGGKDIPPVKGGFRDVPTSQIMLLHPYVAMEYANAEAEGNRFNGTVLIDLVGYNRWRWKEDGSMGFALGASLILSASDHAATDDFALGFMAHVNHYWSIGMVFGGDDPTLVVSADVAQLWTKVSGLRKMKFMTGK